MFFGWYIVGAALILNVYQWGSFNYGFSAFITPIAATYGWGYAQITLAQSLRGLESGALNPVLGMLVDRWPARRLMVLGLGITGLGIFVVSQATSLAMFYGGFIISGLGGSLSVTLVPNATLARWFRTKIGKASGVATIGYGIGGMMLPVMVKIVDTFGWQNTFLFMAIGTWLLIPLAFVFRTSPEQYGLAPDGKTQDGARKAGVAASADFSLGVKEAIRTRAFWCIGITGMLQLGTQMAILAHVVPYFSSLGIARATAGMVIFYVSWASLATRFPIGWLSDIFPKKYVAAGCTFLASVGLFLVSRVEGNSFATLVLFAIVFGLGIGGMAPLRVALPREYFGPKRFATIYALMGIFTTIGSTALSPIAGWVFDIRDTYDPIWLIYAVLSGICVVLLLIMPTTGRKPTPAIS